MKTVLLFPPTWHPSQPYVSLPALVGFLKAQGVQDIRQRDINVEVLDILLTRTKGLEIHQRMRDKLRGLEAKRRSGQWDRMDLERYARIIEALERFPDLLDRVEPSKQTLRAKGFYAMERYRESLFIIDQWLDCISALYHPTQITLVDNHWRYSIYSSQAILKAVQDEEENPYLDLYRQHLLPGLLSDSPDFVGISITATSQIIPGLTLAGVIKKANPNVHLTIGGSIFTRLVENLMRTDSLFSLADDFVVFEGEHALLELIGQLEGKRDFSKVPNLVYRKNGSTAVNPFYVEKVNALPTPDYDGFPLDLYLSPELVLPIPFSRGCYYKKCAFCALTVDHKTFRQRHPERMVEDLRILSQKYQTPYFFFTDECLGHAPTKRLCTRLIESGLDLKWTCEMRFEKNLSRELLRLMADAGCLKIVFGLESFNQRVLDLMKKGIKRGDVRRIMDDCLDLEIAVHCYIIVGFPTEMEEEAWETVNFILGHKRLQSSYGFSCQPCLFDLEKDAAIMQDPGAYGIRRIMSPASDDLSLGFFYEVERGMTPERAERMYQIAYEKVREVVHELPFNYSMSDGLLYIDNARTRGATPASMPRNPYPRNLPMAPSAAITGPAFLEREG